MSALAIIVMGLALLLAHTLRGARGRFRLTHAGAFVLGLLMSALVIRFFAIENGIERRSDYDRFVLHGLNTAEASDRPLWIFVGASYSRNAINAEGLTERLRERGLDVQVINLSLQGASLQERRAHLEDFLARTPRLPERVFLEVAPEFDADPVYVFQVAKFSDRAIDQFTPANTARAASDILARRCGGLMACAKAAAFTGSHGLMNALNIGLLYSGERLDALEAAPSWDPQSEPREGLNAAQLTEISAPARGEALLTSEPAREAHEWGAAYRGDWVGELEAADIAVGLYFPPVLDAGKRAYGRGLCAAEEAGRPCLIADAPQLLATLDADVWFDPGHLLVPGAEAYIDWLADRLVEIAE